MKVGDTVIHPQWGRGVILAIEARARGPFIQVKLGYATNWFPASEFPGGEGISAPARAASSMAGTPARHSVTDSDDQRVASARSAVHALKLGQVLEAQVERTSVGTAEHEQAFSKAFAEAERRKPQLIMIEGAWGIGKTHLDRKSVV